MSKKEQKFIQTIWDFYTELGRHDLPWRQTTDPYHIHVSEVMLQQTQVGRVVPKYKAFIARWPSAVALARASLGEVLQMWQGLGYNRRAKYLHECVQVITRTCFGTSQSTSLENINSVYPRTQSALMALPGIGNYTAGAIMVFSYNEPVVLIETNIRTVFLYHFFKNKTDVSDKDLLLSIEANLPIERSREWYWALMDYGSYLKQTHGNNTRQSRHYTKQSTFQGSDRQIRGAIIKYLTKQSLTGSQLTALVINDIPRTLPNRITAQLQALTDENLIVTQQYRYRLP